MSVERITVKVVDHQDQRYETCGDWTYDSGLRELTVRASRTGDWREPMTVAIHEAYEGLLCIAHGISQNSVDRFDVLYEQARSEALSGNFCNQTATQLDLLHEFGCECVPTEDSEPGEDHHAPYYKEHMAATVIERLFAWQVGLHWPTYEDHIQGLFQD